MNKKNKWLLAMVCACITLGVSAGCNVGGGDSTGGGDTAIELNLIRESVELELFEEHELQYTYTGDETLSWRVEDSSIVTVENGKLVALKEGETTVTVQVGDLSDVCTVKVNGLKSELLNVSVSESQISMYARDTYTLKPVLVYGEKTLSEGNFSYESSDFAIVSVSSTGVLTANSVGQASVFVTATVLEKSVGCMVNVSVNKSGSICLDLVQTELYALAEYEGKTYKNETQIQATVTEKGDLKNATEISWVSSDEAVATVENGKVVAVGVGSAEITATYVGEDGNSVEAVSFVTVLPVTHTVERTADVIKTRAFTVDGLQAEITSAYVTDGTLKTSVPISDGALDFTAIGLVGKTTLVLNCGNVLLNMPIYLWTDVITDVEGLSALQTATHEHYRLEADLDLTDFVWQYKALEEGENPIVFKGVFDGGEHTLTNFAPINGGLFYALGNSAKVQNVRFVNAVIASNDTSIGCIAGRIMQDSAVTIENITGNIINSGNACGGLFGQSAGNSQITINACKLHVYSANNAANKGAIVGASDGVIVLSDDSSIYASLALCGGGSGAEAINQLPKIQPSDYGRTLNIYDILAGGQTIMISENNIVKATLFSKTVEEVAYSGGVLTIPETAVQNFVGNALEVAFEKEDGTTVYYAINVEYGELKLINDNKELLKYAQGGTILLQEDIDMGGETWTTSASFAGVLDGNGFAIKNLVTSGNDTNGYYGLFKNIAGEVKNIAFIGVKLGKNSGVLAGRTTANVALNNVFIQVSKASGGRASAVVDWSQIAGVMVNLTDVVIVMPKNSTKEYIYGVGIKGVSTLTNVHCIGLADGAYSEAGTNYINLKTSTVTFHTDKISFNLALDEENSEIALTEFNKTCVDKYYSIVAIGQKNVTDLLTVSGNEHVYLTEDIDLADIEWNSTVAFTGVFDGNNHTIKNLTTVTGAGFFKTMAGTIKNIAFANVTLVAGTGVLCYQTSGAALVENVFIQVVKTNSSGSNRFGAICERSSGVYAVNLTNVVIKMPGTAANEAIYGYTLKGVSSLTNVHCIGLPNEAESIQNEGTYFKGTYTFYADLVAFTMASADLTGFLKECVTEYFNVVNISQSNVTDLLTVTNETVVLTEDIDLTGIEWNTTVAFSGVFDGCNHTIKNLTTVSGSGGFFQVLSGTVKNVAFTNVTLVAGTAVLAFRGGESTSTVENVFIQVVKTNKSASNRFGVICERQNNVAAINLKNVVIQMPGTAANEAIYGYTLKGVSTLSNVHCIGLPNEAASVHNTAGDNYFNGTYTFHTDLAAFNAAEKTLTEFLAACVTAYLQ